MNKLFFIILIFPLASLAQNNYTEGVKRIVEILYPNTELKKTVDETVKDIKRQVPEYAVEPLGIVLPTTIDVLVHKKVQIKYVRSF